MSMTRAEAIAELTLARRVCVRLLEATIAASLGHAPVEGFASRCTCGIDNCPRLAAGPAVVEALAAWAVHTGRDGEAASRASGENAPDAMLAADVKAWAPSGFRPGPPQGPVGHVRHTRAP